MHTLRLTQGLVRRAVAGSLPSTAPSALVYLPAAQAYKLALMNAAAENGLVSALVSASSQPSMSMIDRIASPALPLGPSSIEAEASAGDVAPADSEAPSSITGLIDDLANSLSGAIMAIKRTYRPSVVRKKRTHGFLHRNATTSGQKLLTRRKRKGRKTLCP